MSTINRNLTEEDQKFFDWVEKNQPLFPEKYYADQKDVIIESVEEIWRREPNLPIRKVIVEIMSDLPDFLPAENLIFLTKLISEEWEKHQKKKAA